ITVEHPKGIAENVLVEFGKFIFPVDFIILDMPEDFIVPLILEKPFLSTAQAKIDMFKRMITLRTLVLNRSLEPLYGDYIELNDLNVPLELRRDQVDDLVLTVEEGKDKEEVSSDDNEMVKVKVLKALAEENDAVKKEGARNDECVKISMRKFRAKDIVFVKCLVDDTKVTIPGVERPWLSKAKGFILPNHDTSMILPSESQRNTTDSSVAVTDSSATDYDLAYESSVCSIPLPPLKKHQTNNNDVSFIEPYECPEPVVIETKVSSDQNDQTDQNDQPVQNDKILNDDHSEHSNHTNDEQIIDSLPNTKDIQIFKHLSSLNTKDTSAQNTIIPSPPLPVPSTVTPAPQDRWYKDKHIKLVNVIGNPGAGMLTRSMTKQISAALAHECLFVDFLSKEEPKKVSKVLKHPEWVDAMQDELNQFARNKV
nr:retrovirus-related Pol polyprotein from transposon TNT 1-94 [Tanacetum cinerariifolium]